MSNDSNNSMDLCNLMNFQKDIDKIKTNLEGVTRKNNLDEATKDLIENLVYNCPQSNRGISKISEQED